MPGHQPKAFLRAAEAPGWNQRESLQPSPLSSWQQDEAQGTCVQAVVELPHFPAPVPGCSLWVVHLQSLESEPCCTQPECPLLTFAEAATFCGLWGCGVPDRLYVILTPKLEPTLLGSLSTQHPQATQLASERTAAAFPFRWVFQGRAQGATAFMTALSCHCPQWLCDLGR